MCVVWGGGGGGGGAGCMCVGVACVLLVFSYAPLRSLGG